MENLKLLYVSFFDFIPKKSRAVMSKKYLRIYYGNI